MPQSNVASITQPPTLGAIIESLLEIRDERRRIAARDKELVEAWRTNEMLMISALDAQGSITSATTAGRATISEEVVPNVDDWDAFYDYIWEQKAFHLLQKRPAAAAYRELVAAGEDVKGLSPFTKRSISLSKK